MWSPFHNDTKTKNPIENDMNFSMSLINKFGDVDQQTIKITGKAFYRLLTNYCDQKQHRYVYNGTVKYRNCVDLAGKPENGSSMINFLPRFENYVKKFIQV